MPVKITVNDNGSLKILADAEGDFEIYDPSGQKFDLGGRTAVSLCRCGASANKPFCDGAHKGCGFEAKTTAFALPPKKA